MEGEGGGWERKPDNIKFKETDDGEIIPNTNVFKVVERNAVQKTKHKKQYPDEQDEQKKLNGRIGRNWRGQ